MYKVISARSPDKLSELVDAYLALGYDLAGGVQVTEHDYKTYYYQAVCKK